MPQRRTVATVVFYLGLGALMVAVLTGVLQDLMPAGIAARVGYNSEGYLAALLLGLWIQVVRPRLAGHGWQWPVTLAVGVALAVIALLLFASDLPSRFKTLNETLLGLALVVPYVQVRRPLPPRLAVCLSAAVLAVMVAFNRTEYVTTFAEGLGLLLLVPLAFDVVDRGILEPDRRTSPRLRYGWYALLVLMPVTSSLLYHGQVFGGLVGEGIRYQVRLHESFVGMLLVQLYLAVGLGRTGRRGGRAAPGPQEPRATSAARAG
jgi:hypothetical protein